MTTIIILGEPLPIPNAYDATEQLVNFHAQATLSRFQYELEALVKEPPKAHLKNLLNFTEYKTAIDSLDDKYSIWSIRDDRLVFLLPEFGRLVKGEKLIWNDTYTSKSEYVKDLQALNKKAFEKFTGPKLHLTKKDEEAVEAFVNQPEEKQHITKSAFGGTHWQAEEPDSVDVPNPFDEPGNFGKGKSK